ncbi:MAG: Lrp/AsnC family transcriptional regulator [Candidatus Nanohaloarchaeota archaeon QJJ-9]|nr:Lrp/AsnC family transcriptional regulator [Candidatus Nanohaloarchaeota archaeon QJJ-9]
MVDEKDRRILDKLRENSRMPTTEISEKLGIARTTVHSRIEKMKEEEVIKKFTVRPDYSELGRGTTAFVLISFDPKAGVKQKETARQISEIGMVDGLHIISGEWDLLAKVRGESAEEIGDVVVEKLREIDGVEQSTTCVSFETILEDC